MYVAGSLVGKSVRLRDFMPDADQLWVTISSEEVHPIHHECAYGYYRTPFPVNATIHATGVTTGNWFVTSKGDVIQEGTPVLLSMLNSDREALESNERGYLSGVRLRVFPDPASTKGPEWYFECNADKIINARSDSKG